ncbi:hypothetical protein DM52_2082 [Burkholderia mallei]|nr:hypothetical protein DM52_2082 [Burkholderia mallei]
MAFGEFRDRDEPIRIRRAVHQHAQRVVRVFRESHTWQKDACIMLLLRVVRYNMLGTCTLYS